jgi:hypothetical protein
VTTALKVAGLVLVLDLKFLVVWAE